MNRKFPTLLFATLALAAGCHSGPVTLTARPIGTNQAFAQTFTEAYSAPLEGGGYQFLLVSDDADKEQPSAPGATLKTMQGVPLRQVIHIKVLWRPMNNTGDTANAAIEWFVLSNASGHENDLLRYQGAGAVFLDPTKDGTKVSLRGATIRPTTLRGELADPIGQSRLSGNFMATNSPQRLRDVLDATRTRASGETAAQSE